MPANRFYDKTICFVQAIFSGASSPFRKYNIFRAINVESSRSSPETRRCARDTSRWKRGQTYREETVDRNTYITFHSTSFGRKRVATNESTRSLYNALQPTRCYASCSSFMTITLLRKYFRYNFTKLSLTISSYNARVYVNFIVSWTRLNYPNRNSFRPRNTARTLHLCAFKFPANISQTVHWSLLLNTLDISYFYRPLIHFLWFAR